MLLLLFFNFLFFTMRSRLKSNATYECISSHVGIKHVSGNYECIMKCKNLGH